MSESHSDEKPAADRTDSLVTTTTTTTTSTIGLDQLSESVERALRFHDHGSFPSASGHVPAPEAKTSTTSKAVSPQRPDFSSRPSILTLGSVRAGLFAALGRGKVSADGALAEGGEVLIDGNGDVVLTLAAGPATLLVTDDLNRAINDCRRKVGKIAAAHRAQNRRFRDSGFDIASEDPNTVSECLQALYVDPKPNDDGFQPGDVARVSKIFSKPSFFVDGARSEDIMQGQVGDCWFVSALATVSSFPDLIERICVARDEEIGVYGFIFFRDGRWETTIIDDYLFLASKQWNKVDRAKQFEFRDDRKLYEKVRLRGSRALYFAHSSDENETWVALLEKAYAKAHGDYQSISGGWTGEALEDLTGGTSTRMQVADILDTNNLWAEFLRIGVDLLFACYASSVGSSGLISDHAYTIVRALEVDGQRFIKIQNPWGRDGEWKGPWSDGSKEWTPEWMEKLRHRFGNDGIFMMTYEDFLDTWDEIDRTRLYDYTWSLASCTLTVKSQAAPRPPMFGDVSFTFKLEKPSPTVFVLSTIDSRYFVGLEGETVSALEFVVYKKGESELLARSVKTMFGQRGVNVELNLEPGEYVVHVRRDIRQTRAEDYLQETINRTSKWGKFSAAMARAFQSESKAANFALEKSGFDLKKLAPEPALYRGRSLAEVKEHVSRLEEARKQVEETKTENIADKEDGQEAKATGEPESQKATVDKAAEREKASVEDRAESKKAQDSAETDDSKKAKDSADAKDGDQSESAVEKSDKPSQATASSDGANQARRTTDAQMDGSEKDGAPKVNAGEEKDGDAGSALPLPVPVPVPKPNPQEEKGGNANGKEGKDDDSGDEEKLDEIILSLRVYSQDPNSKVTGETKR